MEGSGEIARLLRALAAFAKDLGLAPSTHMAAYNHLLLQLQGI